ncbi:MAG TPA: response regulator transcription factor [Gaiellaceae bacterium]
MKVFVVDAHSIYRGGLAACLATFDEVSAVGDAESVAAAKRDRQLVAADVVLVDSHVPAADGFARWVTETTGARVLLCGSRCDEAELRAAMCAGAVGFLCKETLTPETLHAAVRSAAAGTSTVAGSRVERRDRSLSRLTSREQEVLRLVAAGHATREVARRLCYSERTIKNVIHDVVTKLNARTRSQAVAEAVREGLI